MAAEQGGWRVDIGQVATSARQNVETRIAGALNTPEITAIRRFTTLERVLAAGCVAIPLLLILFDSWTVRESISAYYSMDEAQWFYVPLTIAALLFVVNGVIKNQHAYNTWLGVFLLGVVMFNTDDVALVHMVFASAFFGGNVLVILFLARGVQTRVKWAFGAAIVIAMAAIFAFDWFTLFWAEWLSLTVIAVHYLLDSSSKVGYRAVRKGEGLPPARYQAT